MCAGVRLVPVTRRRGEKRTEEDAYGNSHSPSGGIFAFTVRGSSYGHENAVQRTSDIQYSHLLKMTSILSPCGKRVCGEHTRATFSALVIVTP